jgi:hypothetical protein
MLKLPRFLVLGRVIVQIDAEDGYEQEEHGYKYYWYKCEVVYQQ